MKGNLPVSADKWNKVMMAAQLTEFKWLVDLHRGSTIHIDEPASSILRLITPN